MQKILTNYAKSIIIHRKDHEICIKMQRNIREFSFLNDLWDSIDVIEVEERER